MHKKNEIDVCFALFDRSDISDQISNESDSTYTVPWSLNSAQEKWNRCLFCIIW